MIVTTVRTKFGEIRTLIGLNYDEALKQSTKDAHGTWDCPAPDEYVKRGVQFEVGGTYNGVERCARCHVILIEEQVLGEQFMDATGRVWAISEIELDSDVRDWLLDRADDITAMRERISQLKGEAQQYQEEVIDTRRVMAHVIATRKLPRAPQPPPPPLPPIAEGEPRG